MQNIKDASEYQISPYLCDITNVLHYHTCTLGFLQNYSVTCRENLISQNPSCVAQKKNITT